MCLLKIFKCFCAALSGDIFPAVGTLKGAERSDDAALNRLFYQIVLGSEALIVFMPILQNSFVCLLNYEIEDSSNCREAVFILLE